MRKIARTTCGLNDGIIDILFEYATLRFHKWMNAGVYVSKKIHLVPIKCIKHTRPWSPSFIVPKPKKRIPQKPGCHSCASLKSWGINTLCSVCARKKKLIHGKKN
mmetsp:Transcript_26756/g.37337  ORF Transcript_26756/g.37337 Transcript_26756/m.37337 type:complete len:105 (-) Transcript_26756:167-481(-)